jgi:hypothetical protein
MYHIYYTHGLLCARWAFEYNMQSRPIIVSEIHAINKAVDGDMVQINHDTVSLRGFGLFVTISLFMLQ